MAEAQRGPIAVSERCHTAAQLELLLEVEAERQSREVEEAIAAEEANDHHILSHPHQCISMQLFPLPFDSCRFLCFVSLHLETGRRNGNAKKRCGSKPLKRLRHNMTCGCVPMRGKAAHLEGGSDSIQVTICRPILYRCFFLVLTCLFSPWTLC